MEGEGVQPLCALALKRCVAHRPISTPAARGAFSMQLNVCEDLWTQQWMMTP